MVSDNSWLSANGAPPMLCCMCKVTLVWPKDALKLVTKQNARNKRIVIVYKVEYINQNQPDLGSGVGSASGANATASKIARKNELVPGVISVNYH